MKSGRFELRRDERRVLVDGRAVPLGARAFDVLVMLADHCERVVSKGELLEQVWKGAVVEEANLNVQVSNLRKLLGREMIATVPGRGYRFVLPAADDAPQRLSAPPVADAPSLLPQGAAMLPQLPAPPLGRSAELARLDMLLGAHRLVTVLGPGGIGKTTLALATAHAEPARWRDGIIWLELAHLGSPDRLAAGLAAALHLPPSASDDPLRPLIAALRSLRVLLVLDNAEHLVDAVAQLAQGVLAGTPHVQLLVTSQASLRLPNEQTLPLGPLDLPTGRPAAREALQAGAVRLFVERARRFEPGFSLTDANVAAVVDICRRLDGVALAIELATARLPLLGLAGLQQRLGERFALLTRGTAAAPARQQTLRSALDWSYGLLAPQEQRLFRLLGVFVGGFTLELTLALFRATADEAADEWTVIDLLDGLVHRSLVAATDPPDAARPPRYRLLESARNYALLSLDTAGERLAAHRGHARALAALAETAAREQWTTPEPAWLARHAPEQDNLRAALDWAAEHDAALAAALAAGAMPLFEVLSLRHEMRPRIQPLLAQLPSLSLAPTLRGRFLLGASAQERDGSTARQRELALGAVDAQRVAGDEAGLYEALYALSACFRSYPADAVAAAEEMARVESPAWPPGLRALRPIAESKARYAEGRMAENRAALERALPLVLAGGIDRLAVTVLGNTADHALFMGQVEEAVSRGSQLCALLRRSGRVAQLAFSLANLAAAHLQQPAVTAARAALEEALDLMRTLEWSNFRDFGDVYALLAAREGRLGDAARLIGWQDRHALEQSEREPNEVRCRALADAEVRAGLSEAHRINLERLGAAMDEDAAFTAALAARDGAEATGRVNTPL